MILIIKKQDAIYKEYCILGFPYRYTKSLYLKAFCLYFHPSNLNTSQINKEVL